MNLNAFFTAEFDEHLELLDRTRAALHAPFLTLVETAVRSIHAGGKIVFCGNGGSAADSQHLATELTVRYKKDRKPIAAIALTTDSSALTAIGNDIGFDALFSRQVEALCGPNDLVIGISTSGRSPNVLKAVEAARALGARTAGFLGRDGGPISKVVDIPLIVPSNTTARIQEYHIMIGQMLCGALEIELGLVPDEAA